MPPQGLFLLACSLMLLEKVLSQRLCCDRIGASTGVIVMWHDAVALIGASWSQGDTIIA